MTAREEVIMLREEVAGLRMLTIQQAKLTEELSIIIKGSESLGVEGIRVRQRKDEIFKEKVLQDIAGVHKKFDENARAIMEKVDSRVEGLEKELREVVEWKTAWNKAIGLISSSTTWRVVFMIGLGIAGIIIFAKFKIFEFLQRF